MKTITFLKNIFTRKEKSYKKVSVEDENNIYINYYDEKENWGDSVNLYLLHKISGKKIVKIKRKEQGHILPIGSIMRLSESSSVVWGSGFISSKGNLKTKPNRVCAVRGPLTKKLLEKKKILVPEVFGDPALLMPRFYFPTIEKKYQLGVVPHYVDKEHPMVGILERKGAKIIDIQQSAEGFVNDLLCCENIISSSLHGLIASDAYNISNLWVDFTGNVTGKGFKFNDYYLSIGEEIQSPINIEQMAEKNVDDIVEMCQLHPVNLDLEKLLGAFPGSTKK